MIQITIKKQNVITNQAIFETQELADSWLASHVEANSFGLAAREEHNIIQPYVFATFDDDGILLTEEIPAVYETINHVAEYTIEQIDISNELALKKSKQDKILAGKAAREACQQVLDLIAGDNLDKVLTMEQITEMQTVFGPIQSALMTARPSLSKILIGSVEPSELVSAELKDSCLELLADY